MDDLFEPLKANIEAHEPGQAPSSSLLTDLTNLLFPALTSADVASIEEVATLLNKLFDALPSTSNKEQERQTLDESPENHFQLLQTALLDALWSLDVLFDSNGQVWPPPANSQDSSPQRLKLRQLLALLVDKIPLPLQKLRIALTIATEPATEGRIAQGEVRMRTGM
jgi:hypothetical protein